MEKITIEVKQGDRTQIIHLEPANDSGKTLSIFREGEDIPETEKSLFTSVLFNIMRTFNGPGYTNIPGENKPNSLFEALQYLYNPEREYSESEEEEIQDDLIAEYGIDLKQLKALHNNYYQLYNPTKTK